MASPGSTPNPSESPAGRPGRGAAEREGEGGAPGSGGSRPPGAGKAPPVCRARCSDPQVRPSPRRGRRAPPGVPETPPALHGHGHLQAPRRPGCPLAAGPVRAEGCCRVSRPFTPADRRAPAPSPEAGLPSARLCVHRWLPPPAVAFVLFRWCFCFVLFVFLGDLLNKRTRLIRSAASSRHPAAPHRQRPLPGVLPATQRPAAPLPAHNGGGHSRTKGARSRAPLTALPREPNRLPARGWEEMRALRRGALTKGRPAVPTAPPPAGPARPPGCGAAVPPPAVPPPALPQSCRRASAHVHTHTANCPNSQEPR